MEIKPILLDTNTYTTFKGNVSDNDWNMLK